MKALPAHTTINELITEKSCDTCMYVFNRGIRQATQFRHSECDIWFLCDECSSSNNKRVQQYIQDVDDDYRAAQEQDYYDEDEDDDTGWDED